jgi:hypothetical protein
MGKNRQSMRDDCLGADVCGDRDGDALKELLTKFYHNDQRTLELWFNVEGRGL